ncbi:MAG: hypothetical protein KGY99_10955 [Phycisphaerae bacterium]|nr:hypothetical protein [Phycisphaerae bacterium]
MDPIQQLVVVGCSGCGALAAVTALRALEAIEPADRNTLSESTEAMT